MIEFIKAAIINLAVIAIWYYYKYSQFKELQWDQKRGAVVVTNYSLTSWILLLQARK